MCKTGQFRDLVGEAALMDSGTRELKQTQTGGLGAERKMAGGSAEDEASRPLLTHLRRVWVRKPLCGGLAVA
jgi:hypothetical protein